MEKIITLFQRNYTTDRLVRDEVVSGAEWVLQGEGMATRKYDGTCCLVRDGVLYRRYELKSGRQAPDGFFAAQAPDPITQETPGWVPVGEDPSDRWHREAFDVGDFSDGTYELCGPKIQGNHEGLLSHQLIPHGRDSVPDCPRTFVALRDFFATYPHEGIVWHHPDGRMVKLKRRDFFKRAQ